MVYAGLLGVAQGIHKLCIQLDYADLELHIYGQGAERSDIIDFIDKNPDLPIFFHGELTRLELLKVLPEYDMAIIPLLNRIYGSVPSKIFELAMLGLPVVYFGGGEGENIIKENGLGWIANAGDYSGLNRVINNISLDDLGPDKRQAIRETAIEKFNFRQQLNEFIGLLEQKNQ